MKKYSSLLLVVIGLAFVILWQAYSSYTSYYVIAVAVLVLSMLPFFFSYENSKPSAREIALISTLTALAVVSRTVFYLIPQVKPIGAVVIVSGVCLGAKRGYLIGALSAFISNFIFGQGIWTPFQMVALGSVGLVSGLIFNKKTKRVALAVAGFLLTFLLYGVLVDSCSVILMTSDYSLASVLSVYSAGLPFSLAFGVSTAVFLFLFGEAFIKKINRITTKYGIVK